MEVASSSLNPATSNASLDSAASIATVSGVSAVTSLSGSGQTSSTSALEAGMTAMSLEQLDKECSALGAMFQQIVVEMKNGVPFYEEFVNKASKLHGQLKSTILVLSSFLDTFQKIADAASNTKGSTRDIGACLTRIVLRHKSMESRMKALCQALLEGLVAPLSDKLDDWKKNVTLLDKDHAKEYKKLRAEVKKRHEVSTRVNKKHGGGSSGSGKKSSRGVTPEGQRAMDVAASDLNRQLRHLHETEKNAVRRAMIEERSRYCAFVQCIKPILGEEIGLVSDFQQLEEVYKRLGKSAEEPFKLPAASEQVILDVGNPNAGGNVENHNSNNSNNTNSSSNFELPPSSPSGGGGSSSSLGSRKSSMCSISSVGSNGQQANGGSPHHLHPGHNNVSENQRKQLHQQQVAQLRNKSGGGGVPPVQMMRLSSISSQDSGFTSQDTLFLRPGSPGGSSNATNATAPAATPATPRLKDDQNGLNERPHTISTAYESKGLHQRPQLQPYTFQPPCESITEHQDETSGQQMMMPPPPPAPTVAGINSRGNGTLLRKPPIPQRCVSLENGNSNSSGNNGRYSTTSLNLQQQQQNFRGSNSSLPNFNSSREDMVLPQPVYMNMGDLADMAAQRAAASNNHQMYQDDGELKTPTVEDNNMAMIQGTKADGGSSESSLGSSSGYGSQNTVRTANSGNQYIHHQHQQQPQSEYANANVNKGPDGSAGIYQNTTALHEGNAGAANGSAHHYGLRRSATLVGKPPPPARPQSGTANDLGMEANGGILLGNGGSNSSTPRGSMENLPPPPPHLLHSDDDLDGSTPQQQRLAGCRNSVAESVRALQQVGHQPASPKTLRRAHSVASGSSPYFPKATHPKYQQPNSFQPQQQLQEPQIYAPVAHLQQKMMHQQQMNLQQQQQMSVQQQQYQLQQQQFAQQQQQLHHQSPEGDKYGFGMQFHQHQNSFMSSQQQQQFQQQQPPKTPTGGQSQAATAGSMNHCDAATALRVRRWIETRSSPNVRDCRPLLNMEIERGLQLRKTSQMSDRSAPRF